MDDLISKDRLVEALGISDDCVDCQHRLNGLCLWKPNMVDVCEVITEMPSAEHELKRARWQEDPSGYGFWICSNCGFVSEASGANILYSFCPHCGAEMKGEADDV